MPDPRLGTTASPLPSTSHCGPLAALFHDADRPRASDEEVAWYVARLPRAAGTVLEPMSGSGRMLVPLLDAGIRVHGVDVSEPMLASCAARLASAGRDAQLFREAIT